MTLPDFSYEQKLWEKGYQLICGVDEVGRGCFAGPVFAGAVVFDERVELSEEIMINDSKKLTKIQREKASDWIRKNALSFGIGSASVAQINKLGIVGACEIAFRKAIKKCIKTDYLLIDTFYIPYVRGLRRKNQLAIKKGDSLSVTIAAASIVAKVERDAFMDKLGGRKKYGLYKWKENKGYGTKKHQEAIIKYGLTSYHRTKFVETFLRKQG